MVKKPSHKATVPSAKDTRGKLQSHTPGADIASLGAKADELVAELAPTTALEHSIARDIAGSNAELTQLRARKNLVLWQKAITPMYDLIRMEGSCDEGQSRDLAIAWASGASNAQEKIADLGVDPEIAHNQAFIANVLLIELMDKQIERLEGRRRKLLEDYRCMQPIASKERGRTVQPILDAEVIVDMGKELINAK